MKHPLHRLLSRREAPSAAEDEARPAEDEVRPAEDPLPVHHFGMTRFSLFSPTASSWRLTRRADWDDTERYADHLYSAERMEPRCAIFCDLAAPLFQEMAENHRFRQIVAYSPQMPQRWLDRLRAAADRYPVLWPVEFDTHRVEWPRLMREHLAVASPDQESMVFAFRIDDDDLLSADFLDQVEPYVVPHHQNYAISFADGYAGLWDEGRYTSIRSFHRPLSSMGQGSIGRWDPQQRVLDLTLTKNHNRPHLQHPVLLDGRRTTFLQTRHLGQDTAVQQEEQLDAATARANVLAKIDPLPPVTDLEAVYQRFPVLRGHVRTDEATGGDPPS